MPKRFDFVSPGIQLNEVDETVLSTEASEDLGPVIIGRSLSGPAMKPVKIKTLEDFNEIFGLGISGKGNKFNDVWRYGNSLGPTYAVYAAQAHLASETSPVTFLRLLGEKSEDANQDSHYAGWNLSNNTNPTKAHATNVSAYGLFIAEKNDITTANAPTGSLAAIFYVNSGSVALSGTMAQGMALATGETLTSSVGTLISSIGGNASKFKIDIRDNTGVVIETKTFDFEPGSNQYIRNQFSTNPQLLEGNKNFGLSSKNYFLGETYEEAVNRFGGNSTTAGDQVGIILALDSGSLNHGDHKVDMLPPKTGWFINREQGGSREKLFRLVSLHEGEWLQNNYHVVVKDLSLGNDIEPNSTFTIEIRDRNENIIEQFSGLNLDPSSEKYISKAIGDQYQTWDSAKVKYNVRGEYENNSNYIYVEVASAVTAQQLTDKHALPVGFYGPVRPKGFQLRHGSSGPLVFGTDAAATKGTAASFTFTLTDAPTNTDIFNLFHTNGTIDVPMTASNNSAHTPITPDAGGENPIFIGSPASSGSFATNLNNFLNGISGYSSKIIHGSPVKVQMTADQVVASSFNLFGTGAAGDDFCAKEGQGTVISSSVVGVNETITNNSFVVGNASIPDNSQTSANIFAKLPADYSASFNFPSLRLTDHNANSNGNQFAATDLFGVRHHRATATRRDDSYIDIIRVLPTNAAVTLSHHLGENESLPRALEYSFIFSLDDVVQDLTNTSTYYYKSGSFADTDSWSSKHGIKKLFENKVRQFRAPFFGGHDGVDLKEVEPFSNKNLGDKTRQSSYAYNSVFKALESISDPEAVKFNVLSAPGITATDVTDEIIKIAEDRQDHLAIIDIEGGHKPAYENNGTITSGDINGTITSLEGRKLNTSYVSAYYPWVRLRDRIGGQNDVLYVPPSVAAIGALAKSSDQADLWFAPAGFNRGGINELGGIFGPIITGTWEHLTKDDRDELYTANINPIARFPSMNQIVVFGQKTLLQNDSALNRINVRRLLIYLKYRIGLIADTILFDQNVNTTWNRFRDRATAILLDVQDRLGVSEFKLVLDSRTTTQDLVDRNIMYAKIYIKPTRSIEFIAVDFIISRSGVQF